MLHQILTDSRPFAQALQMMQTESFGENGGEPTVVTEDSRNHQSIDNQHIAAVAEW
jgi:hypothetical protein